MPMTFENKEYLKLKETKDDEFSDLIGGILVSGETIVHTYKSVRDGIVFTNKRLIAIDIQGITGKKKNITILVQRADRGRDRHRQRAVPLVRRHGRGEVRVHRQDRRLQDLPLHQRVHPGLKLQWKRRGLAPPFIGYHSHSMVPGGLAVTS